MSFTIGLFLWFLPLDRFYGFYHWTVWWSPPACRPDWHSVCQTDPADPSGSVLTVPAPPLNVWLSSEGRQATHNNKKRNLKFTKSSQPPIFSQLSIYKTDDCIHAEYNHNSFNNWMQKPSIYHGSNKCIHDVFTFLLCPNNAYIIVKF